MLLLIAVLRFTMNLAIGVGCLFLARWLGKNGKGELNKALSMLLLGVAITNVSVSVIYLYTTVTGDFGTPATIGYAVANLPEVYAVAKLLKYFVDTP